MVRLVSWRWLYSRLLNDRNNSGHHGGLLAHARHLNAQIAVLRYASSLRLGDLSLCRQMKFLDHSRTCLYLLGEKLSRLEIVHVYDRGRNR